MGNPNKKYHKRSRMSHLNKIWLLLQRKLNPKFKTKFKSQTEKNWKINKNFNLSHHKQLNSKYQPSKLKNNLKNKCLGKKSFLKNNFSKINLIKTN